jgi:integrase
MALKPVRQIQLPGFAGTSPAGPLGSSGQAAVVGDLAHRRVTAGGWSNATSATTPSSSLSSGHIHSPSYAADRSTGAGVPPLASSPVSSPGAFTGSLFDPHPRDLAERLARAFDRWCDSKSAQRPGRRSVKSEYTREVYATLWGGFASWCCARQLDLPDLQADDLLAFFARRSALAGRPLSKRYKLHLLRLVASVIDHEAQVQQVEPNIAPLKVIERDEGVRHADARLRRPPITALDHVQARNLIAFTTSTQALRGIGVKGAMPDWQGVRARACVALQLGAGLTPAEARALRIDHVVLQQCPRGRGLRPWKVAVPQVGDSPAREVPLMPWAASVLHRWLQVRREQGLVGNVLLPTDRSGLPMSRSLHYLSVKAVFEGAQILGVAKRLDDGDKVENVFGGYVLRHTFALICLHEGYTFEQVAMWLGLKDLDKMRRYQSIVFMPHGRLFGIGVEDEFPEESLATCEPS